MVDLAGEFPSKGLDRANDLPQMLHGKPHVPGRVWGQVLNPQLIIRCHIWQLGCNGPNVLRRKLLQGQQLQSGLQTGDEIPVFL